MNFETREASLSSELFKETLQSPRPSSAHQNTKSSVSKKTNLKEREGKNTLGGLYICMYIRKKRSNSEENRSSSCRQRERVD